MLAKILNINNATNACCLQATWAPGIGIKNSEFKNRWDVDFGITYIPWDKLPHNIDAIAEGGVVDEGSLPEHFQGLFNDLHKHFKVEWHLNYFFLKLLQYNLFFSFVHVF